MGLGALVIDLGQGRQNQQQAQSSADAGALAGADAIPAGNASTNVPAVTTAAASAVQANTPGAQVSVTMPTTTSARVSVAGTSANGLGQASGSASLRVSASATATSTTTGGTPAAIFASASTCGPFSYPGISATVAGLQVNGNVTTNGSLTYTLAGVTIAGTLTYGCLNVGIGVVNATSTVKGPNNATFPYNYAATYPSVCTSPPAGVTVTNVNSAALTAAQLAQIPSGIICDSQSLTLTGTISGAWTFVAPSISVGLGAATLTPAAASLPQFWATTGNITFNQAGLNTGTVYAPNGTITLGVANATFTGYLEAQQVSFLAAGITLNGTGPSTGGTQTSVLTQ